MNELKHLTDRELLKCIYILLVQMSKRLNSLEENTNDFMMNIVANILADRMINTDYGTQAVQR